MKRWLVSWYRQTFYPDGPTWAGMVTNPTLYFILRNERPDAKTFAAEWEKRQGVHRKLWLDGIL